jgi:hypothetical protein
MIRQFRSFGSASTGEASFYTCFPHLGRDDEMKAARQSRAVFNAIHLRALLTRLSALAKVPTKLASFSSNITK